MQRLPGGEPPDPRRARLVTLTAAVALAIVLPLAVASAGPVGGKDGRSVRASGHGDGKESTPEPRRSPLVLGLGLATAARCGPELSSPDGVEAQTCVLTQGPDTWARTYYRNATGDALRSVLSLMGPGGGAVRTQCALGAEDEPGTCETPRRHTAGDAGAYTAVAEFAVGPGGGRLLLRVGSDSGRPRSE
ncbi:hypothetical protein ACFY93_32020 [Streptomyces sp. NPDC008313]|uniref:hypothetical protein n=1 Tax=Streptomyces sp. NPDC008313 TaxID=3364826 RepID=UPI0036EEEF86